VEGPRAARATAVAVALFLLVAACTGGATPEPPLPTSPTTPAPRHGGSAVFAAEGWAECLNPILWCGRYRWAWYTVFEHVLPRAMQLDPKGSLVASPLLVRAPTLQNGGLRKGPPFTITYEISDRAVWSDGSRITANDFAFTWKAVRDPTRSGWADRYSTITSIDTSDPGRPVLTLREPIVDWPELFGGTTGFILKRSAFPDADPDRPDLRNQMARSIPFSGGPWLLKSWSKDRAVLSRNALYFGAPALLDQVTFVRKAEQVDEFKAYLDREVAALYPQPSDVSMLDSCCEYQEAVGGPSTRFVGLWFDARIPPLNDRRVREALMYAVDRQLILDQLVKLNDPNAEVLNCGFMALPNLGPWCATRPFQGFTYDPARARALLEEAGYDCSGRPCTKGGKPLRLQYMTRRTDAQLALTQDLVKRRAAEAGFELRVQEVIGLFVGPCPVLLGRTHIVQCAREAPLYGSVTDLLSCGVIPTRENFVGENLTGWCNPEADRLMRESDQEIDPAKRLQLLSRVHELQAEDLMGLPLFAAPAASVWRSDQIAGPIGRWNGSPYGMFFNMNEWHLPS
jgi:peptide/nickel transport system substrate-binding protein